MNLINYLWIHLFIATSPYLLKGWPFFTMVNISNFTQNLMKHSQMNLDTYWCSANAFGWTCTYQRHVHMVFVLSKKPISENMIIPQDS